MNVRKITTVLLVLAVMVFAATGTVYAQAAEPDQEAPGQDSGPPLPDEEIGDAVADPAQLLDATVEPDKYQVEVLAEPAEPVEPADADEQLQQDALLTDGIPIQGRLTDDAGKPLDGVYNIRFALYLVQVGGVAVCLDTDAVPVTNGLFSAVINSCTAGDISGQQLYLGIKVGADPEMTPRQPVYATPYARSLRPGALIYNTGAGHALTLRSVGAGLANAALWAENTGAQGIGVWARTQGSDATIVSSNNGTGALFKGFGSGGGEDEFRIDNDGSVQTKADSYVFISGNVFKKNVNTDTTRWDLFGHGDARIWRGADAGQKILYFPITLPSVLYGQPVEIERITIYYDNQNGANNYITRTVLRKQTAVNTSVVLVDSGTDRTSNVPTSYTLTPDVTTRTLSAGQGALGLYLYLQFANDTEYIDIGGIRLQLGHHDLY